MCYTMNLRANQLRQLRSYVAALRLCNIYEASTNVSWRIAEIVNSGELRIIAKGGEAWVGIVRASVPKPQSHRCASDS
jgi:hypothetical protein